MIRLHAAIWTFMNREQECFQCEQCADSLPEGQITAVRSAGHVMFSTDSLVVGHFPEKS